MLTTWHSTHSPAASSIDISCRPGPQQQTCGSDFAAVGRAGTGSQTDIHLFALLSLFTAAGVELLTYYLPIIYLTYYAAPDRGAEYCDVPVCLPVCVCLSAIMSSELYVRSSPKFLCMLPMAVTRSSSGDVVIRHVIPVLWMTSYLLISQGCSTSPPS